MPDREKVMQWLETCVRGCEGGCPYEYKNLVYRVECKADLMRDALALLKEQEEIKEQFIEAFKTIRNAYNVPANREKILLNYLLRIAGCCE